MNSSNKISINWKSIIQQYLDALDYKYKTSSKSNKIDIPFEVDNKDVIIRVVVGDSEFPKQTFLTVFSLISFEECPEEILEIINEENERMPIGCISINKEKKVINVKYGTEINEGYSIENLDSMIDFTIFLNSFIMNNKKLSNIKNLKSV